MAKDLGDIVNEDYEWVSFASWLDYSPATVQQVTNGLTIIFCNELDLQNMKDKSLIRNYT